MNNFWHSLLNIGITHETKENEKRQILLMNIISVILVGFGFIIIINNFITFRIRFALPIQFVGLLAGLLTLLFNKWGYSKLSKYLLVGIPPVFFLCYSIFVKINGEGDTFVFHIIPRFLILIWIVLSAVLFTIANKRDWIIGIAAPLLCYVLFEPIHNFWGVSGAVAIHLPRQFVIYYYSSTLLALPILLFIYFLQRSNWLYEQRIYQLLKEEKEQKNKIETQKQEIAKQKDKILASILYASRIQYALLPDIGMLRKYLPEAYVLYKPKDIVSGDFYWFLSRQDYFFVAAIDCTGHGVPGALMSMLANNLLNDAINQNGLTLPAEILNYMQTRLQKLLRQEGKQINDGMDIALAVYHFPSKTLNYAGAMNPLLYIVEGSLYEIAANKIALGGRDADQEPNFNNFELHIEKPTSCYLFSDGYKDQFGGPQNRKFSSKKWKELLLEIHTQSGESQKDILQQTFNSWKGNNEQTDDVLVIGFRLMP